MKSDLPKVVHEVAGAPMIRWVVHAARQAGCSPLVLVVGHGEELVRAALRGGGSRDEDLRYVRQEEQLGTGHAVQCAAPALENFQGEILVLAGDGPLIRPASLRSLIDHHRQTGAEATLATAVLDDPAGYGRILRDEAGGFLGIVEDKHATDRQREIREINPSVYCFAADALFRTLPRLERRPGSGEYYLTDAPGLLVEEGRRVEAVNTLSAEEAVSVNTPGQLAEADRILRNHPEHAEASA